MNSKQELINYLESLELKLCNQQFIALISEVIKEEYDFQLVNVDDLIDLNEKRDDKIDLILDLVEDLRNIEVYN